MRIPESSPIGQEPRSIQLRPSCERIVTVFARLVPSFVCLLIGVPAAMIATDSTVSPPGHAARIFGLGAKGRSGTYVSDSSVLACGGVCPGVCPCPSALKDGDPVDI